MTDTHNSKNIGQKNKTVLVKEFKSIMTEKQFYFKYCNIKTLRQN